MEEDATLDLAIVRNRLLAGKADPRDEELLSSVCKAAREQFHDSPYIAVLQGAIKNALTDIRSGALELAAQEIELVHNLPLSGSWSAWNEEYFLKGALLTYIERAPVDRVKALLSSFARYRGNRFVPALRRYRDIPSFFILDCSVVRFIPRRAAAPFGPPTTPLDCSSTRRM